MADNVTLQSTTLASPPAATIVACDEVAFSGDTAKVQLFRQVYVSGGEGAKTVVELKPKDGRTDTYTNIGTGTTVDVSSQGMSKYSIQVVKTGTVTAWTVDLEISLDGVVFKPILTHMLTGNGNQTVEGDGAIASTTIYPANYFHSKCTAFTGSGSIAVTILGLP